MVDPLVALEYALRDNKTGRATIFKLDTDFFMNRGVDLRFCSAFPEEREFLYPPCTCAMPSPSSLCHWHATLPLCHRHVLGARRYLKPTHKKKQRLEVRRMASGTSGKSWRVTKVRANATRERLGRVWDGFGVSGSFRSGVCVLLDVIEVKPSFPRG